MLIKCKKSMEVVCFEYFIYVSMNAVLPTKNLCLICGVKCKKIKKDRCILSSGKQMLEAYTKFITYCAAA